APANGEYYVVGEEVTYRLEVTNNGTLDYDNCIIMPASRTLQEVNDVAGYTTGSTGYIASQGTGSYEGQITVTAEDIEAGSLTLHGVALCPILPGIAADVSNDGTYIFVRSNMLILPAGGELTIVDQNTDDETSGTVEVLLRAEDPANGTYYVEGETVQFTATTINSTGDTIYHLNLYSTATEDDLEKPVLQDGELAAGEPLETTGITYTITKEDVENGSVDNQITGSCSADAEGNDILPLYSNILILYTGQNEEGGVEILDDMSEPVEDTDIFEEQRDVVLLKYCISKPANGVFYVEGEQIQYLLNLINYSDKELTGIEISDPLKGNNEDAIVDIYPSIPSHGSCNAFYTYTVKAEDVAVGQVENRASAGFRYAGEDTSQIVNSRTIVSLTGSEVPAENSMTITKEEISSPENGSYYMKGETVRYQITLKNNTGKDYQNVTVFDDLDYEGRTMLDIKETVETGTEYTWFYEFLVNDKSVMYDYIDNIAWAEYFGEGDVEYKIIADPVRIYLAKQDVPETSINWEPIPDDADNPLPDPGGQDLDDDIIDDIGTPNDEP
ncbi:MAG: hypothetical protein Q4B26_17695, partial [Eubacteriales bacterium]|nr:hypothetical protein [Eubacteriales bacterium]